MYGDIQVDVFANSYIPITIVSFKPHCSTSLLYCIIYYILLVIGVSSTWSYSLIAVKKMTAFTPSNAWIHFLLSDLWPPTSIILEIEEVFKSNNR